MTFVTLDVPLERPPAAERVHLSEFHSLPHWKPVAWEVKKALHNRLPSRRCREGDYFRSQAQHMEEQFINCAVQHTLHLLEDAPPRNRIYDVFLERELRHAYDQLQSRYAHILKPEAVDEQAHMDEIGTPEKATRMATIYNDRQRHGREMAECFAIDIADEIRQSLDRRGLDTHETNYRLEQKGIEQPDHLPFVAIAQSPAEKSRGA